MPSVLIAWANAKTAASRASGVNAAPMHLLNSGSKVEMGPVGTLFFACGGKWEVGREGGRGGGGMIIIA
jgi:hypothetical protein